ncbi:dihydrolipoamide acetyltransferase family protein [Nonomuraea typhae]|uniref:dihydrolipoamide acetyltransferase family protein n=1 Tax=Nonomuraea typhae TaxID=2603600 RepID=UPI0012FC1D4E|nr:dihydrolipoamide acetyltransferase family protein [Nonomuraea typhae]
MARVLHMPEVAAGAQEAVLQTWGVTAGVPYAKGEVIATVETDKAVVEVEAEEPGVLLRTLVGEGATVTVGAPIAVVGAPGEPPEAAGPVLADPPPSAAPAGPPPVRGLPPDVPSPPGRGRPSGAPAAVGGSRTPERVFSSPLARRLAGEAGLRVEDIPGSGPNGRVVRKDVEAAVAARLAGEPAVAEPAQASADPGAYTEIPHTRMRRAIAARLTESKRTAPHFYLRGTARADALLAMRAQLNQGDLRVSVNDLIVKAAARAHVRVPAMNVTWSEEAVRAYRQVDLAVAVATEAGLVTPVLRDVAGMTLSRVAAAMREYGERARTGRLRQDELEGGTLTITNLGMYGTEEFAAIVNPPQAAILAVGAARRQPVVEGDAVVAASVLTVTLSVDHRPVDGVVAAEWMKAFLELLENPVAILA